MGRHAVAGRPRNGVATLVAHLYDDRTAEEFPAATAALWRPWRRLRLAEPVR